MEFHVTPIRTMQRLKTFRSSEVFCSHLELRGAAHFSFSEKKLGIFPNQGGGGQAALPTVGKVLEKHNLH